MHSVFSKLNFDPAHYSEWIYSPLDSMILVWMSSLRWMGSPQTFTWLQSFSRESSFCHMVTFIFDCRGLSVYTLIHNNLGLILHLPNMLILA